MTSLLDAPPANTPAWVAWRKGGLGASDIPAILGLDPYKTEHELWLTKTGQSPDFNGNAKTRWGHRLEALGLRIWEDHNPGWIALDNSESYTQPAWPHLWATPDGQATPREVGENVVGVEVKVTGAWQQPPDRVKVQCLVQMGLADLERVDVVRLSFEDDPAIFRVDRDDAAIADILAAGEAWYVKHVLEGVEPPMAEGETPADERLTGLAHDLRGVRKAMDALARQERSIKDDLIASVAGRGVIAGHGFRIEVRGAHDRTTTGWKEVAAAYRRTLEGIDEGRPDIWYEGVVGLHQETTRAKPSVYPTWNEEE